MLAAAETGSGKTGAFGLPILQVVHESIRSRQDGGTSTAGYDASFSNITFVVDVAPNTLVFVYQHPKAFCRRHKKEMVQCVLSSEDRDALLAVTPDGKQKIRRPFLVSLVP